MRPTADSPSAVVGVISDTHGLLRPEAVVALSGCDQIVHGGDLGNPEIYERLSRIAPTAAIRGNVDRGTWAEAFPETLILSVNGIAFYVLHDLNTLDFDPVSPGITVVVSGHSHQPRIHEKAGALYVNPGSAGPRRFKQPVTVARLNIVPGYIQVEIVDLLENKPMETLTMHRSKPST